MKLTAGMLRHWMSRCGYFVWNSSPQWLNFQYACLAVGLKTSVLEPIQPGNWSVYAYRHLMYSTCRQTLLKRILPGANVTRAGEVKPQALQLPPPGVRTTTSAGIAKSLFLTETMTFQHSFMRPLTPLISLKLNLHGINKKTCRLRFQSLKTLIICALLVKWPMTVAFTLHFR